LPVYSRQEDIIIQSENHEITAVTQDTLFDGRLKCLQSKDGYRFSIDSVILAHFIVPAKDDVILDLGTGCGVIPLIIGFRWGKILKSITGLELQDSLVDLARKNIDINGYDTFCRIIAGDVKSFSQHMDRESFTKVICNPPFYQHGTGRINRNKEVLLARHQISATLEDFVSAAAAAVKNRGFTYFVYPAERLAELFILTNKYKLEPKQIMLVYSYPHPGKNAELVLLKCLKNGGVGVEIIPPLYVFDEKNGEYSADMERYYR